MELTPFITISGHDNKVKVAYIDEYSARLTGIEETVDLGPNPTWPSPTEIAELVATAVHQVMMRGWTAATGETVCICDKPHNATTCPDHPTCQGDHRG